MKIRDTAHDPIEEVSVTNPAQTLVMVALGIALGFYFNFNLTLIIVSMIVMITMHELGHYLTARAAGMKVTEFFIGFGPRIWSIQRGETEYGVKAIPAGAYVRIIGMSNLEDVDPEDEARTYRAKAYGRRMSVAVAGSTMHFLMAFVLILVVFAGFGLPNPASKDWSVATVVPDSPALLAGIHEGDRIVAIDGRAVATFDDASQYFRAHPGGHVTVSIEREGEQLEREVTLAKTNPNGDAVGFLGVAATAPVEREAPATAVVDGAKEMVTVAKDSVLGLVHIFSPSGITGYVDSITSPDSPGAASSNDARPISVVGIAQAGSQAAEHGLVNVVYMLFAINIFIGIFNLIPMLPFDGGHVAIATYEKIRSMISGRRYYADVAKLLPLTYVVVLVLALLFITSIYSNIVNPVSVN
jgi:membrane-associated protease RseP (regulator of RpoE activity)